MDEPGDTIGSKQLDFYEAMADFKAMFPMLDDDIIESVLRSNDGSVDKTVDQLLAMTTNETMATLGHLATHGHPTTYDHHAMHSHLATHGHQATASAAGCPMCLCHKISKKDLSLALRSNESPPPLPPKHSPSKSPQSPPRRAPPSPPGLDSEPTNNKQGKQLLRNNSDLLNNTSKSLHNTASSLVSTDKLQFNNEGVLHNIDEHSTSCRIEADKQFSRNISLESHLSNHSQSAGQSNNLLADKLSNQKYSFIRKDQSATDAADLERIRNFTRIPDDFLRLDSSKASNSCTAEAASDACKSLHTIVRKAAPQCSACRLKLQQLQLSRYLQSGMNCGNVEKSCGNSLGKCGNIMGKELNGDHVLLSSLVGSYRGNSDNRVGNTGLSDICCVERLGEVGGTNKKDNHVIEGCNCRQVLSLQRASDTNRYNCKDCKMCSNNGMQIDKNTTGRLGRRDERAGRQAEASSLTCDGAGKKLVGRSFGRSVSSCGERRRDLPDCCVVGRQLSTGNAQQPDCCTANSLQLCKKEGLNNVATIQQAMNPRLKQQHGENRIEVSKRNNDSANIGNVKLTNHISAGAVNQTLPTNSSSTAAEPLTNHSTVGRSLAEWEEERKSQQLLDHQKRLLREQREKLRLISSVTLRRRLDDTDRRLEEQERDIEVVLQVQAERRQVLEDERLALLLQNEEFLAELRHDDDFISTLTEEQRGFSCLPDPHSATLTTVTIETCSRRSQDLEEFQKQLKNIGDASRSKLFAFAQKFLSKCRKKSSTQRNAKLKDTVTPSTANLLEDEDDGLQDDFACDLRWST